MFKEFSVFIFFIVITNAVDPWTNGPYETKHRLILASLTDGLDHQIDFWTANAKGTFPIIINLSGMGGIFPGDMYDNMFSQLASHGVAIIQPWAKLSNPSENYHAEWLLSVIEWAEHYMENQLHLGGFAWGLELDWNNILIMGHSSGAHVVVEFLKHHCQNIGRGRINVRGQILFSPVDGVDPFGLIHDFAVTPGQYLNYALPTLVITTGLDGVPGHLAGDLTPACVPEGLGNKRFYDAMPGSTWMVNATAYGHGDVLDDLYYEGLVATQFCSTDQSQDRVAYRTFIAGEIWSFVSIVIHQDCQYQQFIQDPSLMIVETTAVSRPGISWPMTWQCGETASCVWNAHIING